MSKFLINTFDDAHIFRMTDDTGMFQHARFSVPDLLKGYTTDDNARALIMAVMLYESTKKPAYLALIYRYLSFVVYAQTETGLFRNFMTYGRQFTEEAGSDDCFGRCLWALGYTQASPVMPAGIKETCIDAINRALPNILTLTWSRGQAYALIGLGFVCNPAFDQLICKLADSLVERFEHNASEAWQWFEDELTYDNAVLPWALFVAYGRLQQDRLLHVAQKSLSFLNSVSFRDGYFRPVGCNGWLARGAKQAEFDEQPLEACTTTLAHLAAYQATDEAAMLEMAQKSFAWYSGRNSRGESLIDSETGGCCDGITPGGLNRNQGAESIVSYSVARLALVKYETATSGKLLSYCSR